MPLSAFFPMRNGGVAPHVEVPVVSIETLCDAVVNAVQKGGRLAALFGHRQGDQRRVTAVVANEYAGTLGLLSAPLPDAYSALTPHCPQAHWFERELAEQWGVTPEGHPWLKPIRFHASPAFDAPTAQRNKAPTVGVTDFFQMQGDDIHEVAVGPVHAGVIEPGHFRFQCHGERVFHLEISLGYQHRGVERALIGGPNKRTLHYVETLAGDTTVGHALAYCQNLEALSRTDVPIRAQAIGGIALELERLANHTGDLGALANDVGYLPTASYCGRLRGDFLNMTALACGNRFGRSWIVPGGVRFDLDGDRTARLQTALSTARRDLAQAVDLLWNTPSVMARFEHTGALSRETGEALGLVGPPARATGLERDVRYEFPTGIYRFAQMPISTWSTGDVFARAHVRWLEMQRAIEFLGDQLSALPEGPVRVPAEPLRPDAVALSLIEGWRGEICHVAFTDPAGRIARYKVVDPSFHNWMGLAMALRDQEISDFPLCNKSFNLSYCGHDL